MNNMFQTAYYNPVTKRFGMTAESSATTHSENGAIQSNNVFSVCTDIIFQHYRGNEQPYLPEQSVSSSSSASSVASPEYIYGSSPTFSTPYLGHYESPSYEGSSRFEVLYSPVIEMQPQLQRNQHAPTTIGMNLFDDLQSGNDKLSATLSPVMEPSVFDERIENNAELDLFHNLPEVNNPNDGFETLPIESFNGDSTVIDNNAKVAELNNSPSYEILSNIFDNSDEPDKVYSHMYSFDSQYTTESEATTGYDDADNLGGAVTSDSENEGDDEKELFPPLSSPGKAEEVDDFSDLPRFFNEFSKAMGETDSPLTVLADDNEMNSGDGDDMVCDEVEEEPQYDTDNDAYGEESAVSEDDEKITKQQDPKPVTMNNSRKRKAESPSSSSDSDNEDYTPGPSTKRRRRQVTKANNKQQKKKTTPTKRTSTGGNDKPFKCEYCGHASKRRYNLTTHMKTHNKDRVREFPCSECSKAFDRRHDRDRHIATVHEGKRAYVCNECDAHFSRGDALARHMEKHLEEDEVA